MNKTEDQRGFAVIEFADYYGAACTLHKSSLATADCVWLGVNEAEPKVMASQAKALGVETEETVGWVDYPVPKEVLMTTRMHLSREHVAALLPHLQRFAATGEI